MDMLLATDQHGVLLSSCGVEGEGSDAAETAVPFDSP